MTQTNRLLLDRGLLLSALIDREKGHDERLLSAAAATYDALLYEGAGASGIEAALRKRADLASRLVVIAEDAADVDIQERELLRATLTVALTDATVLHRLQRYQTQALAHSRDRAEILGYAFRLLLLARQLRADLLPWPPRAPLVLALLEAAGVRGSTAPADAGMVVFETEPCVFPYLPPRSSPPCAQPLRLLVAPEHVPGQIPPRAGASGADRTPSRSIFVSYSHRDRRWLDKLSTMLRPLARDGSLELWSDELIRPGADWRDDIRAAIERSAVAVLLVSANFLASEFIAANELAPLLEAAEKRGTAIVWVPVSDSLFAHTPLARYQAAHDPRTPLDTLPSARCQQALARIADQIAQLASTGSHARAELGDHTSGDKH